MKYKLSEIMDLIGGGTPKTSNPEYWNGNIPWLSVKDFGNDNRYVYETEKHITKFGLMNSSTKLLDKGDIIISARGTVGEIATIPYPMAFNQSCYGLRAKKEIVDEDFLYYLIKYNIRLLRKNTHGSVFDTITRSTFDEIEVDVPDLEVQKKIGYLLSELDKKIELNNKINNNLLEQASTLFNSAIQQSTSVVYAELGSLADVKGGKRLPKGVNLVTTSNQHPYIRVRDLNNTVFASLSNDYEYVDDETQQSISRYIVSTGDLLISIVGTIGLTAIVDHTLNKANLTENCVKLTNLKNVTPEYLLLFLRSSQGVEAISKGTVGAVQLKLPIKNIQSFAVPLLCNEELLPLNETLSAIFSQISVNIVEMKQLADIRDTILPKLMSGEFDVSGINL
jgi:type I restriction enzyme S subunit